ncbi:hypothetical protein [Bacillus kwashiorkori]|nr:hypothetical protein [Bacillus kwashiorkori]
MNPTEAIGQSLKFTSKKELEELFKKENVSQFRGCTFFSLIPISITRICS